MIQAARVARTFRMDPLTVLAGTPARAAAVAPRDAWWIRAACHNVVVAEESHKTPATNAPDGVA